MKEYQIDLFSNSKTVDEVHIEEAQRILALEGYIFYKVPRREDVGSISDIVSYFYGRLYRKYPDRLTMGIHSRVKDLQMATRFVEAFESQGLPRDLSISKCADIIDTIFDYEDLFEFSKPIVDITILGQDKCRWITEKAIHIMKDKIYTASLLAAKSKINDMQKEYKIDLQEKSNQLLNILKRMD